MDSIIAIPCLFPQAIRTFSHEKPTVAGSKSSIHTSFAHSLPLKRIDSNKKNGFEITMKKTPFQRKGSLSGRSISSHTGHIFLIPVPLAYMFLSD